MTETRDFLTGRRVEVIQTQIPERITGTIIDVREDRVTVLIDDYEASSTFKPSELKLL